MYTLVPISTQLLEKWNNERKEKKVEGERKGKGGREGKKEHIQVILVT